MVLGNVFNLFSNAPNPKADVAEVAISPHAEFTILPCETPHNDNCQTMVQPQGYTGKHSKKYRPKQPKKKSKLDRLIDQEFDELYKNLKQLNENNDCLQLKKCKKQKFKKQDVLSESCRDYDAYSCVANNGWKNMFDKQNTTQQVNYCQKEKEKKSNFGLCLSAFEKIRNRFAKDVGKINKSLDIDIEAAATQHLCKKTRCEKVKDNFTKDHNEMNNMDDLVDSIEKNHRRCCSPKQNKHKKQRKFRKKEQQVYRTNKSSNEMFRNGKFVNPNHNKVLQECTPNCRALKEEDNENHQCQLQEHNSGMVNDQNKDEIEQDEYSKIEQILGQNKKFVLKECEFIFKSPVNKDYLIKIRELEEANEHNKSEERAKNKLMNFICGKNDKTQQPTTSKGKEKSCEEKFKRKNIFDSKGKANGEAKDKKKKSMSLDNRDQGTNEKETMRDKIKSLLCEGRPHSDNKRKCRVCCTKQELCNLPFEDSPQKETGNANKYKPCSRNDQRQTLQNDQRPETIKDKKDMDTIEHCSCNNHNDNKKTNTNEDNRESEKTSTQTEDEFRFLKELGNESFTDHSDTLENKMKKKKFFDAFLQFLEDNKEDIRKQYQEYKTHCSVGGESGDSNYMCWHGQSNPGGH